MMEIPSEKSAVLGIDGGGTNTRAAIVADGKVVGSGQSGSIKRLRVGAEAAEANLRAVPRQNAVQPKHCVFSLR